MDNQKFTIYDTLIANKNTNSLLIIDILLLIQYVYYYWYITGIYIWW